MLKDDELSDCLEVTEVSAQNKNAFANVLGSYSKSDEGTFERNLSKLGILR